MGLQSKDLSADNFLLEERKFIGLVQIIILPGFRAVLWKERNLYKGAINQKFYC